MDKVLRNTKLSITKLSITKLSITVIAVLSIALGIVLFIYPQITTLAICYAFGVILIICTVFHIFLYFKYKNQNSLVNLNLIVAVLTGVVGGWIIAKPSTITPIIPIIFAILLVIHSIFDLKYAAVLKDKYDLYWWILLIMTIFDWGLAAALILNPFQNDKTGIPFIGVGLLCDGISNIWIVLRLNQAEKEIKNSLETLNETYNDENK